MQTSLSNAVQLSCVSSNVYLPSKRASRRRSSSSDVRSACDLQKMVVFSLLADPCRSFRSHTHAQRSRNAIFFYFDALLTRYKPKVEKWSKN